MTMGTMALLTLLLSLAALTVLVLSSPTEGVQLGNLFNGLDIRFPLVVSQCEPVIIYYNMTPPPYDLYILTPDRQLVVDLFFLPGVGYLEWICDIPSGDGFIVEGSLERYYVVQPGSSSSCLHNITTTYAYASINTSLFRSYTQRPSNTSPLSINTPFLASQTTSYPTGSLPTITVNPELAISSATPLSSSRTPSLSTLTPTFSSSRSVTSSVAVPSATASSYPASSSHKSKASAIAGGLIGGVAAVLLTFGITFFCTRRRRQSQLELATSYPLEYPGLTTVPSVPARGPSSGFTSDAVASTSDWNPVSLLSNEESLTPVTPLMATKPDPATLPPTLESPSSLSNLTEALDDVSRLQPDTSQREVLVEPLNNTMPLPQTQPAVGSQNNPSDMITALSVLSRLNPTERRTVVSILHNVITSETSPPGSPRQNSVRAPPPYNG